LPVLAAAARTRLNAEGTSKGGAGGLPTPPGPAIPNFAISSVIEAQVRLDRHGSCGQLGRRFYPG
jgi:hypothetical protein